MNLFAGILMMFGLSGANAQTKPATPPNRVVSIQERETKEQRDARMDWWRKARFGMFIHWGLYAAPAGQWKDRKVSPTQGGEWILKLLNIPVADYKALAPQFNPSRFNADEWVTLAKNAGIKYIVITAKHHDGFAMYHSASDPFNIYDATPFKRDPLQELNLACQKAGIKLGFYYSQDQDWTAPGGGIYGNGPTWDDAQKGQFADYYTTKVLPQLREILNNYQPTPAVLWFDTPSKNVTSELGSKTIEILNEHPNLIFNDRIGGGYRGDTKTPEQHIPPQGYPGKDWETCMTMNRTWGYKSDDNEYKPTDKLLRNLVDIASKGGNYLLNVGPDATGVIPQPQQDRLLTIGKWLKINGESVYDVGPTAFGDECGSYSQTEKDKNGKPVFNESWDWRCTTGKNKLYIHLFAWPQAKFVLSKVTAKITSAYFLADTAHKKLTFTQKDDKLEVSLPSTPIDTMDSVLVLETAKGS